MLNDTMTAHEQSSPGRRLAMLHRLTMAWMSGPIQELGLTRGRIGFLLGVLHREGISQEELTRRMCIDRAATARALQDLETEGFVLREEDPEDRRRKLVFPTDKARELMSPLVKILAEHNAVLFSGFSDKEKELLLSLMDRMVENMRASVEGASL